MIYKYEVTHKRVLYLAVKQCASAWVYDNSRFQKVFDLRANFPVLLKSLIEI